MADVDDITEVNASLLRDWPLPMPGAGGDKEARGHVLIIAGSREMPGALLLSATAALRAGAGKLTIATAASVAPQLGVALPEARVIGLRETGDGGLLAEPDSEPESQTELESEPEPASESETEPASESKTKPASGPMPPSASASTSALRLACRQASAVLIGPGMQDDAATAALVRALQPDCAHAPLILDACAMQVLRQAGHSSFSGPVLLTPHAGEMAALSGADKQSVSARPEASAAQAAQRWRATVALKGALTVIASPGGQLWRHTGGNTGLAISGSGDVLAGLVTGLAARGAPLEQAAAWGAALHAMAGEQLALEHGPLGYLAREISTKIPALLRALATH